MKIYKAIQYSITDDYYDQGTELEYIYQTLLDAQLKCCDLFIDKVKDHIGRINTEEGHPSFPTIQELIKFETINNHILNKEYGEAIKLIADTKIEGYNLFTKIESCKFFVKEEVLEPFICPVDTIDPQILSNMIKAKIFDQ